MSTKELQDEQLRGRYARARAGFDALSRGSGAELGSRAVESRGGLIDEYYELRQEMARRGLLEDEDPTTGGTGPRS